MLIGNEILLLRLILFAAPCTLDEAADVLFIVQQSPCFDYLIWLDIIHFLIKVVK